MASIQPQQSAASIASTGVIEGLPDFTLWILIQISGSLVPCRRSQAWKLFSSSNSCTRDGSTFIATMAALYAGGPARHCSSGGLTRRNRR